jgi:hypothetical protein
MYCSTYWGNTYLGINNNLQLTRGLFLMPLEKKSFTLLLPVSPSRLYNNMFDKGSD